MRCALVEVLAWLLATANIPIAAFPSVRLRHDIAIQLIICLDNACRYLSAPDGNAPAPTGSGVNSLMPWCLYMFCRICGVTNETEQTGVGLIELPYNDWTSMALPSRLTSLALRESCTWTEEYVMYVCVSVHSSTFLPLCMFICIRPSVSVLLFLFCRRVSPCCPDNEQPLGL